MILNLQDFVPYQQSLKWQVQHLYYQNEGTNAWLSADVPFDITSNYRAAYQNARIVIKSFQAPPTEPFYILETGAGVGLFALNFIRAFKDICKKDKLDYLQYLRYMVSDYSQQVVEELESNIFFQNLQKEGLLEFYVLDALHPESIKDVYGEPFEFKANMLTAIIGNYQHDVFPVTPFKFENNQLLAKHLKMKYWLLPTSSLTAEKLAAKLKAFELPREIELSEDDTLETIIQNSLTAIQDFLCEGLNNNKETKYDKVDLNLWLNDLILEQTCLQFFEQPIVENEEHLTTIIYPIRDFVVALLQEHLLTVLFTISKKVISYLEEEVQHLPVDLKELIPDPLEREALENFQQCHQTAYNLYPSGSFQYLRQFWEYLKPEGLLLISDKALYEVEHLNDAKNCEPSIHGNSMAHMVNFPLIQDYIKLLGGSSLQNGTKDGFLYTLLICKAPEIPHKIKHHFNLLFGSKNLNNILGLINYSARTHMIQGKYHEAIPLFEKMMRYRPAEAALICFLATCHYHMNEFEKALSYLDMEYYDYFARYNFHLLRGKIYYKQEDFANALNSFQVANINFPDQIETLNFIGFSWHKLKCPQQAYQAFQAVLALDPKHTQALNLSRQIKDNFFKEWESELNLKTPSEQPIPESENLARAGKPSEE